LNDLKRQKNALGALPKVVMKLPVAGPGESLALCKQASMERRNLHSPKLL